MFNRCLIDINTIFSHLGYAKDYNHTKSSHLIIRFIHIYDIFYGIIVNINCKYIDTHIVFTETHHGETKQHIHDLVRHYVHRYPFRFGASNCQQDKISFIYSRISNKNISLMASVRHK